MREKRLRSDARMGADDIRAAHTLYASGWSVPEIAARISGRYGYANDKQCALALYRFFELGGFKTRSRGEARFHRFSTQRCKCGAAMGEQTVGCQGCRSRAWHRRQVVEALRQIETQERIADRSTVSAEPVAEALREYGAPQEAVAELAGLSLKRVSEIMRGQERVELTTADRILTAIGRPDVLVGMEAA